MSTTSVVALLLTVPLASMAAVAPSLAEQTSALITLTTAADDSDTADELEPMIHVEVPVEYRNRMKKRESLPRGPLEVFSGTTSAAPSDEQVEVTITLEPAADTADVEEELEMMGMSSRYQHLIDEMAARRAAREGARNTLSDIAESAPSNPLDNFKRIRKDLPPAFDKNGHFRIWVDADDIDDIEALDSVRDVTRVDQG